MSDHLPQTPDFDPAHVYEPPEDGVELGTYKSDAGARAVWVERDRTGGTVRARYQGYPEGFQFQPGDETGIELVNGEWQTVPSVVHTIRLRRRVEWWTRNRWSGEFRFLTQMRIDTRPLPHGPEPAARSQDA